MKQDHYKFAILGCCAASELQSCHFETTAWENEGSLQTSRLHVRLWNTSGLQRRKHPWTELAGVHADQPDVTAARSTSASTTTLSTGADAQKSTLFTPAWQCGTGPAAASCCIFSHWSQEKVTWENAAMYCTSFFVFLSTLKIEALNE